MGDVDSYTTMSSSVWSGLHSMRYEEISRRNVTTRPLYSEPLHNLAKQCRSRLVGSRLQSICVAAFWPCTAAAPVEAAQEEEESMVSVSELIH